MRSCRRDEPWLFSPLLAKLIVAGAFSALPACGSTAPGDVEELSPPKPNVPVEAPEGLVSPALVGAWSPVFDVPIEAVHGALLPTGKVVFYDTLGNVRTWDPATSEISPAAAPSYEIFCSGLSLMPDGKLLVAGGKNITIGFGNWNASLFDPVQGSWTMLPDMSGGRWYPSVVTLPSGDMLVLSGSVTPSVQNTIPEVWQVATGSWRELSGASVATATYPRAHVAPNGKVFLAAADRATRYLDTSGAGAFTFVANTSAVRWLGSSVQYDDGKILDAGGGRISKPPLATAEVIDLNAVKPRWTAIAPMANARINSNATILPDGKVLVTGGSSGAGVNNADAPVLPSEMWDPATQAWTTVASLPGYRGYHSIVLLLPDGRLFSAGGSQSPLGRRSLSGEVYSPPYLFKGHRPVITSAPASVAYGQTFHVQTPNARAVAKVAWISFPAVTHAFNMSQRRNVLPFALSAGGIDVTAPVDPNKSPPGYKMLFLLTPGGIPSVAAIVRLGDGQGSSPAVPAAPPALSAAIVGAAARLAWSPAPAGVTGFKIERAMSLTNGVWSQLATVAANATTFTDTSVGPATQYHYRVRSYNAQGSSPYSSTAAVTMP